MDELTSRLAQSLLAQRKRLATAESCTGGLIAACCTDVAGSSAWFERGFVTYSNEAKVELLGVDTALIAAHGAVSEPVARAMAVGALAHSHADIGVAVTGIAGPSGGSGQKPVGTVWLAWALRDASSTGVVQVSATLHRFSGDRASVRAAAVRAALEGVMARITSA